ncbi:MAG TPA: 23S rRNA (pseudouridine(1915)-N(3))-methyltransferase RlmH [Burkholderiales bacterium]|nr:23S rRNA (pseudouridine(1915)-N(3))-methyltransferase RlmH [Burkholderiales bacterium]
MKLLIVAVGHRMPAWVDAGFQEYVKRMPREAAIALIEVKAEPRSEETSSTRIMDAEAKRISAAIPKGAIKVVLDERGRMMTTRDVAARFSGWQMEGRDVAFVIGGADGLAPSVKRDADVMWSLSALTLPHGLVRVVLAEQLYRTFSLLRNHPYHRE